MTLKSVSIIFILAFALLIQNTCPHGFAGKSSVAAACKNCPMKKHQSVTSEGQKTFSSNPSQVHFPLFVFAVPKTIHTFQLNPIEIVRPILIDRYKDALPDELLRPPQA